MPPSNANSKSDDGPHKKQRKEQTSVLNFFATASGGGDEKNNAIDLTDHEHNAADEQAIGDPKVKRNAPKKQKFAIFCDLDGVLVDFNEGVKGLNRGRGVDEIHRKQMWGSIARAGNFFLNLPWTQDGKDLWSKMVENGYYPSILTGVPFINGSREQKVTWCERELKYAFDSMGKCVIFNHVDYASPRNEHKRKTGSIRKGKSIVNIITCWSQNKHFESGANKVLIDDREEIGLKWAAKGGIFIHHITAEQTIAAMVERGILPTTTKIEKNGLKAVAASKRARSSNVQQDGQDNTQEGGTKKRRAKSTQGHEEVICIDE